MGTLPVRSSPTPSPPDCHASKRSTSIPCVSAALGDGGGVAPPGVSPSPPTSLDPDELNRQFDVPAFDPPSPEERAAVNQGFRHSRWATRRQRVIDLLKPCVPPARHDRMIACGTSAWVLRSLEPPTRYRLATNRCRDRWCQPCHEEKCRLVLRNLRAALENETVRFLTLTLKSVEAPLASQLDRIVKAFAGFRKAPLVKKALRGGVYFFEVTLNGKTGLWHPHLHVLFVGEYLPQEVAKKVWLHETGDSYVIDLRGFKTAGHAVGYAAKYVSKGIDSSLLLHRDRFLEAACAFAGRRLFSTFGTLRGLALTACPENDVGWEPLVPLWLLLRRAMAGDDFARSLLGILAHAGGAPPADLVFDSEKPP